MAANKRVPSRRPKTTKDLIQEPPTAHRSRLADRSKDIHEEMHRLECIITAAPRIARQHRLARIDVLPPHETETPAYRQKRADRLPLQHQIALKRHRLRLLAELGIVGVGIIGLAGWLNQYLHIFH